MKARLFLSLFVFLTLVAFPVIPSYPATVVTFDDISNIGSGTFITDGYQGLNWTNFAPLNAIHDAAVNGLSGYYYGMVSASNVAFNAFGLPAELDSPATNFNFLSAYLTGAWRSNLDVEIEGFKGASLVYSQVVVVSATVPTLFSFNYLNVNRLTFDAFGGQYAGLPGGGDGNAFAMDNFTFEFVPEPSTLLLAGFGALMLWPFLKRRRV